MKTNPLETLFYNLVNGNLTTAKAQAKRQSLAKLETFARTELGWSEEKALRAALYLKHPSQDSFQAYCDAV